ncbi:hypothetical protein SAMN04488051_102321 [Alkalimonas amylolytica]|uniref:Uncharacterized protein n=1 Tax=Alkalimonas amylolytica TaxID=152573 RepID=A0A1H3ZS83_ALKAM|nr:hypothetical protein SAMN04488051_102321 [Alkalimonas amylolytica]
MRSLFSANNSADIVTALAAAVKNSDWSFGDIFSAGSVLVKHCIQLKKRLLLVHSCIKNTDAG